MIRSGNYIIIPVEVSSFVLEDKDGKLEVVGNNRGNTIEEVCKMIRSSLTNYARRERQMQEAAERGWKRFQASKEFMEGGELEYYEELWKGYDVEKNNSMSNDLIASYERGIFEITDMMLEYNVPVLALDDDDEPVKQVTSEDVLKLLGNFGPKE